jgi:hypothetical protein
MPVAALSPSANTRNMPLGGVQGPLREGRAWFFEAGRYGFINAQADVVVPPVLEEASNFHDGRALAKSSAAYCTLAVRRGDFAGDGRSGLATLNGCGPGGGY